MMEQQTALMAARGLTDDHDRLLKADDPLSLLHKSCGGVLQGTLAVPQLLEFVQRARRSKLKIAREFSAYDGGDTVTGFARIHPLTGTEGGGCEVLIDNWQRREADEPSSRELAHRLDEVDRASAEVVMRLNADQRIQLISLCAPDITEFDRSVGEVLGRPWTDYVTLDGVAHQQPLHWRLLDGVRCTLKGSDRTWRARLLPVGPATGEPRGFDLLLVAQTPLPKGWGDPSAEPEEVTSHTQLIGSALTPTLRQPIARIISNAETIRSRLAGPLRHEYSEYAGNIASAGQHLNGLLEDLADLEVVEAPGFSTASDPVDLGDAARRAAGILGVRARARNIELVLPIRDGAHIAVGEFRRVLQILINLVGNAIAYSPESSLITIRASGQRDDSTVSVSVRDEGPGVASDQAVEIFNKFERLGRENDGGSGLGLYISHRLAEVMGGTLAVANPGEQGAEFTLTLPVYAPVSSEE